MTSTAIESVKDHNSKRGKQLSKSWATGVQEFDSLTHSIRTLVAKGVKATAKAEQYFIAAGQQLKTLKGMHTGSWQEWELTLKEKCGIGKSRASELMQIADGRKTVAEVASNTTQRSIKHRGKVSPLRNGEDDDRPESLPAEFSITRGGTANICPASIGPEVTAWIKNVAADQKHEAAPDEPGDDEQTVWRRGLMYRAQSAIADAAYEDWSPFRVDQEIIDTVVNAAKAWADLGNYLQRLAGDALSTPAIEPIQSVPADDYPDLPAVLQRAPMGRQ
jgi:hypothetical protein